MPDFVRVTLAQLTLLRRVVFGQLLVVVTVGLPYQNLVRVNVT